jgi:hypothetical protein
MLRSWRGSTEADGRSASSARTACVRRMPSTERMQRRRGHAPLLPTCRGAISLRRCRHLLDDLSFCPNARFHWRLLLAISTALISFGSRKSIFCLIVPAEWTQPEASKTLVPRTRSSHHNCRESGCELRVQSGTRIIELLVPFDPEVRKRGCRRMMRTSESGTSRYRCVILKTYQALLCESNLSHSAFPHRPAAQCVWVAARRAWLARRCSLRCLHREEWPSAVPCGLTLK